MDYATAYDVGDRKRGSGINEDSVAVCVFEDGHRGGLVGGPRAADDLASLLGADRGDEPLDGVGPPRAGAGNGEARRGDPAEADGDDGDDDGASLPETRSVAAFALADGAGGYEAGDVASYIASTVVVQELAEVTVRAARSAPDAFGVELWDTPARPSTADLQAAIADAVETAHRRILAYAEDAGQPAFTTVVAGIAVDGELHYGWVGDSRAYVVATGAGRIEQLTVDHSVVADLAEDGAIDDVEAHVHPRGNEITRALGGHPGEAPERASIAVDTHTVPLYGDDVVLVTSDGLVDAQTDAPTLHQAYVDADRSEDVGERVLEAVVTDDELRDAVLSAPSLDEAATGLVELANERGGKDNLSTVLLRDPALPQAPSGEQLPTREMDPDEPVEDRRTVILPDE